MFLTERFRSFALRSFLIVAAESTGWGAGVVLFSSRFFKEENMFLKDLLGNLFLGKILAFSIKDLQFVPDVSDICLLS